MKIKNIIFETASLQKLLQCNQLPIIMSFRIRDYIKKIKDIEKSYFEEKQKLIEKHKVSDDKGTPDFWKEMNELLNIESEVNGEKLKIEIGKLPDNLLSPSDIINLENYFEFVENKK